MSYLFGELDRYDEESWSLWNVLGDAVDHWHDVYNDYWRLTSQEPPEKRTPEDHERLRMLDGVAPRLFKGALALQLEAVKPEEGPLGPLSHEGQTFARKLLAAIGESALVRDRLSFSIGHEALRRLHGSPERVTRLLGVLVAHQLDERTAAYLSHVSRLYVYGFEIEALVMCRAALDNALQDLLPDDRMGDLGFHRSGPEFSLASRIAAAEREGIFDRTQKTRAHQLRVAANQVLHTAPGFLEEGIDDAFGALTVLVDLLESMSK